ncbi:MAG: ATP-binding protein, partial [Candidatus Aminicenantes bacterium]|nr:ATP-binding protein [Candidatus Aminicenantes bacterium]
MKNPFVYGEVVTGKDFADREDEIKELTRDLKDCEKIFLISPRRYGKTSLIINTLSKLRDAGIYSIYLDLYKATSLHKLLELYAREIAQEVETKLERAIRFMEETLPGLRPKITLNANGSPSIGIDYISSKLDVLRFLDEVFNLPQKLALKKKRNFVVVFDEFQEIR